AAERRSRSCGGTRPTRAWSPPAGPNVTCSSFASPVGTRDFWDESRVQTGCRRSQSPSPGLCPLAERGNHTSHRPTDRQRWRAREQRGYSKMIRRGGEETFTQQRSWKGQEPVLGCCHLLE